MEVSTFISQTIKEIVEGVKQAQKEVADDAIVNPSADKGSTINGVKLSNENVYTTEVEFELVVVVTENKEHEVGGGIKQVIQIGASTSAAKTNSQTNRINFKIPVLLPHKMTNKNLRT